MKDHWTIAYLFNKIRAKIYWKLNQDKPWLTKKANQYLSNKLSKDMIGLEFGSGRSTVFLAKKLNQLTSVEDDEDWYESVKGMLERQNIDNVDYRLAHVNRTQPEKSEYHLIADEFPDNYFDFILIDGRIRGFCTLRSINKLKPGGILVIDNVNQYLPSNSISPNSIKPNGKALNPNWEKVDEIIRNWPQIRTSNGVSDTGIFLK